MPLFLKKKKNLTVLIALIIFQLILISLQVPLGDETNYFERAIFAVFSPIQHGVVSFFQTISNLWKNYFHLQGIQSQNQKMKDEIFRLRQENNILRSALQSFEREKEIVDNLFKIQESILVARVIGVDASNYYKSIIINKGDLDGIKKDMVVLDRIGNLVGRVINPISLKEARVQLITDRESRVSVFSQNKKVLGVLAGHERGHCFFNYVLSTNEDINLGERVITSGFDGIFPPGIEAGKVISITPTTSLFQLIEVRPFFDFSHLDHVAVIMRNPKEIF